MILSVDDPVQGASQLSPEQRFTLAQRILASVEPDESAEFDHAWSDEIRQRIRKYDTGESKGIPVTKVFEDIDRRLVP